ncbi:MAG: ABC transporter substrate-binding protein [Streptomyces sp.]|nr:ABC transporter substrate-binding protein [Streptomyces sp.]NUS11105.1 ABC transporter substrate-binding protein [Streptomyces sp.]
MFPRRTLRTALALTVSGLLLAGASACGSDSGSSGKGGKLTSVSYRGPFVVSGGDAPIYYAAKLGYFADEGLDVTIRDSKGSGQTVDDVANGGSDYGMAASVNVVLNIGKGEQVTSIGTPLGLSSFGFFVDKKEHISEIKQLKGKTVMVIAPAQANLFAALAAEQLTKDDVHLVIAESATLGAAYARSKNVDAVYTTQYIAPTLASRPSDFLPQSKTGFNPPDYAVVVKKTKLKDDSAQVLGFMRAVLRGYQAAKKDPAAAVDALLAKHPELNKAQALGTLKATLPFYCSDGQFDQPYGINANHDWVVTANAMKTYAAMPGATNGTRFYDNSLFTGKTPLNVATCGN